MITCLNILGSVLMIVEGIAILGIVTIGVDLAYYFIKGDQDVEVEEKPKPRHSVIENRRKENLRKQKEESAYEGFFEESYVRGFDAKGWRFRRGHKVPTAKALEYYRTMDELADTQIFDNTEVL